MRTSDYRFTVWVPWDNTTMKVDWEKPTSVELYDLRGEIGGKLDFDFPGFYDNVAGSEENKALVDEFYRDLKAEVNSWY